MNMLFKIFFFITCFIIQNNAWAGAIHVASKNGDIKQMRSLIAKGANVNGLDNQGVTPLLYAILSSHVALVEYLIENDADVNMKAETGTSLTPLHLAVGQKKNKNVKLLIDKGADVHARADHKWTPLFTAASKGNLQAAEMLIKNNADVNAKDENGVTLLVVATTMGHSDFVTLLKKHGAKK